MPHDHGHAHVDPEAGDRRVSIAIWANALLTVAQIVGGILSGSLALIADALHNFSDMASLAIAFAARKIARRPADARMTFGYARIEIVAALINYTTLILIGLYLGYEGIGRLIDPQPVTGWIVVALAGVALVVDLATVALTYAMSKDSVNIRAAFLHNLADAMGSVAVMVAGTLILLYGWTLVDPIVTLGIAGYILWMSAHEIGAVIRILMLAAPVGLDADAIAHRIAAIPGVAGLHHMHLWMMSERRVALDAHLVIDEGRWSEADAIKAAVKAMLTEEFGLAVTTLELECARHACTGAALLAPAPAEA